MTSRPERLLLGIEAVDQERRQCPLDAKPGTRGGSDARGVQVADRPLGMTQGEEGIVVAREAAPGFDLRIHMRHRPEQDEGLIDEVGTEVEQLPPTGFGRGALPPAVPGRLRPPALKA